MVTKSCRRGISVIETAFNVGEKFAFAWFLLEGAKHGKEKKKPALDDPFGSRDPCRGRGSACQHPASLETASPNSAPILSVIDFPTNGSRWPADTPIPISLTVTGKPAIQKVELWIDGSLFDTQTAGDDYYYHVWQWMPLTEGEHAIFARTTDTNHQVAESNVVHIQAEAAAGFVAVVSAQKGDTLPGLAAQNNVPLDQVAASNPTLNPQEPIPAGKQVFIPVSYFPAISPETNPTPAPLVGPVSPASPGGPAALTFWAEGALRRSSGLPEAPGLSATLGVCNVRPHHPG